MGMAVKEREETRDHCAQPDRGSDRECDEEAEHDDRGDYRRLDERSRQAQNRCSETHQDRCYKGHRPHPERAAAGDDAPQSDHDHGEDVVRTAKGVRKPRREVTHIYEGGERAYRCVAPHRMGS